MNPAPPAINTFVATDIGIPIVQIYAVYMGREVITEVLQKKEPSPRALDYEAEYFWGKPRRRLKRPFSRKPAL